MAIALEEPKAEQLVIKAAKCGVNEGQRFRIFETHPIEPPGGTTDTSRSNALHDLVYISLTSARGTSAFLRLASDNRNNSPTYSAPASQHDYVFPLLTWILGRMWVGAVEPIRKVMGGTGKKKIHGAE